MKSNYILVAGSCWHFRKATLAVGQQAARKPPMLEPGFAELGQQACSTHLQGATLKTTKERSGGKMREKHEQLGARKGKGGWYSG